MTVLYQQDSVTPWTPALLTCEKIQLINELTPRPASRAEGALQGWSHLPRPRLRNNTSQPHCSRPSSDVCVLTAPLTRTVVFGTPGVVLGSWTLAWGGPASYGTARLHGNVLSG